MFDDVLSYCRDNGIIESYDEEMLRAVFDGLVRAEDEEDE